jgi:hypothetical protein
MMMQTVTGAPQISMFLYCGKDIDDVNCKLPCDNGDECPLGYECYATDECKTPSSVENHLPTPTALVHSPARMAEMSHVLLI